MENRRKPAPPAATLDINCDFKEYVIDYLAKSFPVRLMAVFTDENGNPTGQAACFKDWDYIDLNN